MNLKCLIVEDSELDAELILRTLKKNGYSIDFRLVETRPELQTCLESKDWDIVTTDFTMPRFSAPEAVELVKSGYPELPVIVVSGAIDSSMCRSLIKKGASDCIAKSELARLPMCIARLMHETYHRKVQGKLMREIFWREERVNYIAGEAGLHMLMDLEGRVYGVRGSQSPDQAPASLGQYIEDTVPSRAGTQISNAMQTAYNTRCGQYFESPNVAGQGLFACYLEPVLQNDMVIGFSMHVDPIDPFQSVSQG